MNPINSFKKIKPLLSLKALIPTLFFNFYYLPFLQAIKFPIWIYSPKFIKMAGTIKLRPSDNHIKLGMIKIGFMQGNAYPNNGIRFYNEGEIIFRGNCKIGNNSAIIVGKKGSIEFGENFLASASVKFYSFYGIKFGRNVIFGWDSIIQDTNFHPVYDNLKNRYRKAFGFIIIGDYNWFSQGCLVLHSVKTPERCIFGARSIITKNDIFFSYSIHMGSPLKVVSSNVYLDYDHYLITDFDYNEGKILWYE